MSDLFTLTTYVPASPLQVYAAWLDGEQHSEMTGGPAHCEPIVGAAFDAWDGYIRGTNLELEPGRRILQSWRTTEFPDDAPDSRIELTLVPEDTGTRITVRHWDIPPGQGGNYEKGWHEHYFSPMRQYFEKRGSGQTAADQPKSDWERPAGDEEVDDWSSESESDSHEVGWEAPVIIEPEDEPAVVSPAPAQPITLQAERPFLEPPAESAPKKPAAKAAPKKAARPAKKASPKRAAKKKKPAKKAARKKTATAKKKAAKKKAAKKKSAKKPAKKGGKKAAKKKAPKKKASSRKKPAPKKKKAAKKSSKKGKKRR
jgi:uncharacterized protein YndB with AHSA1/START domain